MQNDTLPLFPNLIAAAAGAGLTRKELARALGMSVSTLGRRLRGSIEFRWNELIRLRSLFPDTPVSVLLKREKREDRHTTDREEE